MSRYFNPRMATAGGIFWGASISASYLFCDLIPIDFISQAEKCGNYSTYEILLPGVKQGLYAFAMTGVLSRLCDHLKDQTNSVVSTLTCSGITTALTYGVHEFLLQSPNVMQPTVLGGGASLMAYAFISQRKKILKGKLENLLD